MHLVRRFRCAECCKAVDKDDFPPDAIYKGPHERRCKPCVARLSVNEFTKAASPAAAAASPGSPGTPVRPASAPVHSSPLPTPATVTGVSYASPAASASPAATGAGVSGISYPSPAAPASPGILGETAPAALSSLGSTYVDDTHVSTPLKSLNIDYSMSPKTPAAPPAAAGPVTPKIEEASPGSQSEGAGSARRKSVSFSEKIEESYVSSSFDLTRAHVTSEETSHSNKWLRLKTVHYQDVQGRDRVWEKVERTTRVEGKDCDGVGIIAIVEKRGRPKGVVLVRQFRPAIGKITVEFPAGLLDPGETVEDCALRELKEETGFTGHSSYTMPALGFNDPGITNTNFRTVVVKVDGDAPENIEPAASLMESEQINVEVCPLVQFHARLDYYATKVEGHAVDGRMYMFAAGMSIGPGLMI